MVVQVIVDGEKDLVVADFDSALRHAADRVFDLRGDPSAYDELASPTKLQHVHKAGMPAGVVFELRERCAAPGADDVEFVFHDLSAAPGYPSAAWRYSFRDTPDFVHAVARELQTLKSLPLVLGLVESPAAEVDDMAARVLAEAGRAVEWASNRRTEKEALDLLRNVQNVVHEGADWGLNLVRPRRQIAGYFGAHLDDFPSRVEKAFRAKAQRLAQEIGIDLSESPTPSFAP